MARSYWLVKSEPFKYAWDELVEEGSTYWDGVRNYEARNNLQAMRVGDLALYYHSNEGKEVVGIARVAAEHYPDPTADDDTWVVVDFEPERPLERPVALGEFREDPLLSGSALIRRGRLSVVPMSEAEFLRVLELGRTTLSGPRPRDLRARRGEAQAPARRTPAKQRSAKKAAAKKGASAKKSGSKKSAARKKTAKKKAAKKKAAGRKAARSSARKKSAKRQAAPRRR